ncbi:MAG: hypothetical protein QOD33_972, partial [Pyrinomonadaceae bacterium]|nr:hypothetical protein [Pyrinomonadaceae bacterium]
PRHLPLIYGLLTRNLPLIYGQFLVDLWGGSPTVREGTGLENWS